MKFKFLGPLFFVLVFSASCSEKEASTKTPEVKNNNSAESVKNTSPTTLVVADDIMKPLSGTDICFEAVELIRDEGDVATFKDLGDSILLKDDYIQRHGQKTYFGTIGGMLKDNKSIPEIRQVLLNKCRGFYNDYLKQKKAASSQ